MNLALFLLLAAAPDCAPLGHLPTFDLDGALQRSDFDVHSFPRSNGNPVPVRGRSCAGRFVMKAGPTDPPPSEIVNFFKREAVRLGMKLTLADSCQASGYLNDTWFHAQCDGGWGTVYTLTVIEKTAFKATLTQPAEGDFRLLGHMPGYTVILSEKSDGEQEFPVGGDLPPIKAQGKRQHIAYRATDRPQPAADLEIIENYLAAIKARGGEMLFQGDKDLTARFEDLGQVWVHVNSLFGETTVDVLEEPSFNPPITLKDSLDKEGRVALYVNFDFAKATLKPDAAPVIAQIVAFLNANPTYKLSVVGHTDNIGSVESNQKLSSDRAASVVAELLKADIPATRLKSSGAGLSQPIATNETSEGRARNRRVELVK